MGNGVASGALLAQLDEAADNWQFPGLPSAYFYVAASRLTVFRANDEWLVVFQVLGWATREARFDVVVSAFGDRIERLGFQTAVEVVTARGGESPIDMNDNFRLSLHHLDVDVHGRRRYLEPTAAELRSARVDDDHEMPDAARVIRFLAKHLGDELFLADSELLTICGRTRHDLMPFLRAQGWQQPDRLQDERPSDMPCLRSLADAIETDDPGRFDCAEAAWNTDWTYWDD